MAFPTPFASGNPTVDSLFSREFANSQAAAQDAQAAAAQETARQQAMAQYQLAKAQQQGNLGQQQFQNQLALAEFKDKVQSGDERNKLFGRQLDIDEKYRTGLLAKPGARSTDELNIANSQAAQAAAKANDTYAFTLQQNLDKAKKDKWGFMGLRNTDLSPQEQADVANSTWAAVNLTMNNDKSSAGLLLPDHANHTFHPLQYDANGKFVAPSQTTAGLNAGDSTQQYDASGNPLNPAALGSGAAPGLTPPASVTPTHAVTPTVRRPFGKGAIDISADDDAALQAAVASAPPEQRAAVAAHLVSTWLQTGRAKAYTPPQSPMGLPMIQSGLGGIQF